MYFAQVDSHLESSMSKQAHNNVKNDTDFALTKAWYALQYHVRIANPLRISINVYNSLLEGYEQFTCKTVKKQHSRIKQGEAYLVV